MKDMFERSLKPFLQRKFALSTLSFQSAQYDGTGESLLETEIKD